MKTIGLYLTLVILGSCFIALVTSLLGAPVWICAPAGFVWGLSIPLLTR